MLEQHPHFSSLRNPIAFSQTTFHRIRRYLRWHPNRYRMHVQHKLLENNWLHGLRFSPNCEWFNQRCQNESFFDGIHYFRKPKRRRHSTLTDRHNVPNSLSGEKYVILIWFWDPIFNGNVDGRSYLRIPNNLVFPQLANHFNNQ